jgi:hypothetical protein
MEKRDKADELVNSIQSIEPMEDVPADVSARFHATLSELSNQEIKASKKKSFLTGSNQFALAASFVLVFALGIVINLNSDTTVPGQVNLVETQPSGSATSSGVEDDQIQYSTGKNAIPEKSSVPIRITNSGNDYKDIPMDFDKKIGVTTTWNSAVSLGKDDATCLRTLQLIDSTNLIDAGLFNGEQIRAVWAPVTQSSWNVFLIDSKCEAVDKKFVQK